jgi:hypothetical protein
MASAEEFPLLEASPRNDRGRDCRLVKTVFAAVIYKV